MNGLVRRIDLSSAVVITLAGNKTSGLTSADGVGTAAAFNNGLAGISMDAAGTFALVVRSQNESACVN